NALTMLLVHRLARVLADETTALIATASYGVLAVGPAVLGFTANAEHFVVLPAVAGAVVLVGGAPGSLRLGAAGLLLGTAFVMKQPGGAFVLFGLWIVGAAGPIDRRALARLAIFAAASALPFAVTCAAMWALGAFAPFWFWTVTYAREYV